jgi:hypothetical protein
LNPIDNFLDSVVEFGWVGSGFCLEKEMLFYESEFWKRPSFRANLVKDLADSDS